VSCPATIPREEVPLVISESVQPVLVLLGQPVAGNPTQYMMEKAFAHHQLDWRYLTVEVAPEDLGDAIRGMRAMGFSGGNCARPHKQAVIEHLDRVAVAARLIRAVNCILREDDVLVGDNTEGKGLLEALRPVLDPAGKRIVLLGAGRMARAVGAELAQAKAGHITVVDRSAERGQELAGLVLDRFQVSAEAIAWEGDFDVPADTHAVIHATSIASADPEARVPVNVASLAEETLVVDATANPPGTRLVREASERGCPTLDGLEIFLHQVAINFKLWTGIEPDETVLRDAVEEFLEL